MTLQEAQQFVAHFIKGEYSPGDYADFLMWLKGATADELEMIADTHESLHENWVLSGGPSAGWVTQLEQRLDLSVGDRDKGRDVYDPEGEGEWGEEEMVPVVRMRPGGLSRRNIWMAAASVVILLSTGTFIYIHQAGSGSNEMQGREKTLTRTISNPRGGELKEFVLDDGSKVLLNAGTTLKYPPQFSGPERLVELSGEAFFEVAGSSGSPFRVLIRDAEVEVLGTKFNLMAYDDEPVSRTVLVDGAVKIKSGERSVTLKPGQQAEMTYSLPGVDVSIKIESGIDPRRALAWKDGFFDFVQTDLRTIMRSVARTYAIDVQYEPNTPNPRINGGFNRAEGLDNVLKQLESFTNMRFKKDGKTVIVLSVKVKT